MSVESANPPSNNWAAEKERLQSMLDDMTPNALRTAVRLLEDTDPYVRKEARKLLARSLSGVTQAAENPRFSNLDGDFLRALAVRIADGEFGKLKPPKQ